MGNNLYGQSLNNNVNNSNNQQFQDENDVELANYMDDSCGTCARCGSREYLANNKLCSNCSETWG